MNTPGKRKQLKRIKVVTVGHYRALLDNIIRVTPVCAPMKNTGRRRKTNVRSE